MKVGADIEGFIRNTTTGQYIAACGLLGGSKGNPVDIGDGYGVQEDNVTVEFNVPPANNAEELSNILIAARRKVSAYVRKQLNIDGISVVYRDAVPFTEEQLQHPLAKEFGCMPELNSYESGNPFSPIKMSEVGHNRFAGFHLHFGFEPDKFNIPPFVAITLLEALLFVEGTNPVIDGGTNARTRHQFYGKQGSYRETQYPGGYVGVEYRRMGSSMMEHPQAVAREVGNIWKPFETLCHDRNLAAELYRSLDLAAVRDRLYSHTNEVLLRNFIRTRGL